jgi:hypothetical protein
LKRSGYRSQVEQLVEKKSLSGGLSPQQCQQIDKMHHQLLNELKENVKDTAPMDYVAAVRFVREISAELKRVNSHLPQRLDDVSHLATGHQ